MIAIIIVGYNSKKYLEECFSSIERSTYTNYKVIFVDNGSFDDSVEYLRDTFPQTIIIESKANLGFAGGNNLGISRAFELGADYIFLLNPDTVLDSHCLQNLVSKKDVKTVLQPLILLHDGKNKTRLVNTSGGVLNYLGLSYCGDYKVEKDQITGDREIAIASGAAVLVPSAVLKRAGVFDEAFFMYHEDVDLFWRIRIAGFTIKLIPDAVVWHKYSFSRNKGKFFYTERNRLFFLVKNFEWRYLLLVLPILLINEVVLLLYSLLTGWFRLKLRSYSSFLGNLGKMLQQRMSPRTHELKRFLVSDLSFSEVGNPLMRVYSIFLNIWWHLIYFFI